MRTFLIAIILAPLFSVMPAVAAKTCVIDKVVVSENILDKLVSLVKEYTNRVETVTTFEELDVTYRAFKKEMADFVEKYDAEIAAFDKNLSTQQVEQYKSELETAIRQFEKSLEKKAMQFLQ